MAGEKCLFPHHTVDEQPNRKPKKTDHSPKKKAQRGKQAPGNPDVKSWDQISEFDLLSLRYIKEVSGNVMDRRLEKTQVKNHHQRSPCAVKFEDQSREETEREERCARNKAWNFDSAELETMRTSRSPTTVMTANGEVQSDGICQRLGLVCQSYASWRSFRSSWKLCEDHGYTYHWTSGQKTTSHQKWQENWLQCIKLCAIRGPWFICEFFFDAHTYFNHHLHHRIPLMTLAVTPKIQYQKKWEYEWGATGKHEARKMKQRTMWIQFTQTVANCARKFLAEEKWYGTYWQTRWILGSKGRRNDVTFLWIRSSNISRFQCFWEVMQRAWQEVDTLQR